MNSSAKNFSLHDLFIYGFPLESKIAGNGSMELTAEKNFTEDACRVRPAGKSLVVRSINLTYLRPFERSIKEEPSYAGLFRRNNKKNTGGYIIGKTEIFKRHSKAGYCCSGVEVSFLPEFIETFITSRHGISPLEVEETVAGLYDLPFIPDAVVILDRIGKAAFSEDMENLWIETKSLELFSVILAWYRGRKALALPPVNDQDRLGIAQALRYAEEHLSEPLVLRALAKQASMSRSKFTAVFKNHTGLSAAEYVRHLRMEKALNFVKNTNVSLGEIAALVGYRKHSNFSQVFKCRYGVTPGTFRKKILAPTNLTKTGAACTLESI
ncbi:MAG: AraC family transcriptional regulator [Treponema sp.]|jgi:AraC-like DNA-binding protein|nr:AraC family transcriptional regulator [Treponema sp.]